MPVFLKLVFFSVFDLTMEHSSSSSETSVIFLCYCINRLLLVGKWVSSRIYIAGGIYNFFLGLFILCKTGVPRYWSVWERFDLGVVKTEPTCDIFDEVIFVFLVCFFTGLLVFGFAKRGLLPPLQLSKLLNALATIDFLPVNLSPHDLLCRCLFFYISFFLLTSFRPCYLILRAANSSNSSAQILFSSNSCLFYSFVANVCSFVLTFSRLVV